MIQNINPIYGDPEAFSSVEEMEECIRECGYDLPEDSLIEGIDYIILED